MMKFARLSLAMLLLAHGCASLSSTSGMKSESSGAVPASAVIDGWKPENLRPEAQSRQHAFVRSQQVARVNYLLWFGLPADSDEYSGRTVVTFDLKPKAKEASFDVALDFEGGTVRTIMINGVLQKDDQAGLEGRPRSGVGPKRFDGHRIHFDVHELLPGPNRIEIAFNHPYSHNGNGLHYFKDPVDGETYLYSNFEPYAAHRMFPCFDQPDLKATYELTAEVPEGWQVISNTREKEITGVDGRKSWQFPPSAPFSTYLFALHAGPYAQWKSVAKTKTLQIPLRLFARKSLAKYVDHDEWLTVTAGGLAYYEKEFGYPYPFKKYDQVISPDFNIGAMENAAAVTFSERYVYRTKVTTDKRRGRADTILHEMAHMWFGDLVTMHWWNGLWLNESFATFMAAGAVDQATKFPGSWQAFFGEKKWAYWEDQLVTTHPIEVPVPDTDFADSNFDGITYGKGAASLKQLNFFIGEKEFRDGVQAYFQKYAFRNTTTPQFVGKLGEAAGRDLAGWQKSWLQTAGVNTLRADWACKIQDGHKTPQISKFDLIQTASAAYPDLREHKTLLALYKGGKAGLKPYETLAIQYAGATTSVPRLIGKACPDFVFTNHEDHDYAKTELDAKSLEFARAKLSTFGDGLAREMFWYSLWDMVIDGKLRAQDYADTVMKHLPSETNVRTLDSVLGTLSRGGLSPTVTRYLGGKLRDDYQARIEVFIWKNLKVAPAGSDVQLTWYKRYLSAAVSSKSVENLRGLLAGSLSLKSIKIDQDRRWEIVTALSRLGAPDSAALIATELKADATDNGRKAAIGAEASSAVPEVKAAWSRKLKGEIPAGEKAPTYANAREAMRSYVQTGQEDLIRPGIETYFAQLALFDRLSSGKESKTDPKYAIFEDEFMSEYTENMYPSLCSQELVDRATAALAKLEALPASAVKALKINRQEEERCVRARAKSESDPV